MLANVVGAPFLGATQMSGGHALRPAHSPSTTRVNDKLLRFRAGKNSKGDKGSAAIQEPIKSRG